MINLSDYTKRRAAILAQCNAIGIDPIFIDAIDGRNGLPAQYEPLVDRDAMWAYLGREGSDSECACGLSHQLVYERILSENLEGAIVLEDDAILTPFFAKFYDGHGYKTADFIQMDHHIARASFFGHRKWSDFITLAPLAANAYAATGYSITRKAAQFLRDNGTPLAGVADWPCDMQPLRPLATLPRLIESPPEADPKSAIEPGRREKMDEQLDREFPILKNNKRRGQSPLRIFRRAYWKRWRLKHFTFRIS